jgi:hypothetical protein
MNMETKNKIFERYKGEYFKAKAKKKRKEQTRILNVVLHVIKMDRKAAIRKFNRIQKKDVAIPESRGRSVYFTSDVIYALKDVWEIANGPCGELLFPMVSEYVVMQKRDNFWKHSDEATGKLLAMSLGTMKSKVGEFLKMRRKGRGFSLTSPSHLKHIIPIFSGPWNQEKPGSGQIDTVAHCGGSMAGDFAFTLNYTDAPTLWDEARAQWNKGQEATVVSIRKVKEKLPVVLHKIHPDTGSEFINWHCKDSCDEDNIEMTRSRPNHKNDNAYVEERNGHIVRKYVGYIRLDCKESVDALNDLYDVLCPYLNHFITSRRCIDKVRVGARYVKKYEKIPKTPYQRMLENEHVPEEVKEKLRAEHAKLNPSIMKKEIDRLREKLYDVQRKYGSKNS